jgi:DnaJ-class molecular chaperone
MAASACLCSAEWRAECPASDCPHARDRSILENVRPEIRDEVAYAIQLAEASCPICEGTGRATWLDDCQECAS